MVLQINGKIKKGPTETAGPVLFTQIRVKVYLSEFQ